MVSPLAIDLRALRVLVGPDIKIVPGRAVMARVVAAQQPGARGSLSIAGYLLEAELPESVRAGDDLRLVVKDVSAERVLLTITDSPGEDHAQQAQAGAQAPQAPPQPVHQQLLPDPSMAVAPLPLPGGGSVQVTERNAGGGSARGGERHDVLLRYNAPVLGAMDLRFQMDTGALHLGVSLAPGQPLELGQAGAESLRRALAAALPGRTVSVTVTAHRDPLNLYA